MKKLLKIIILLPILAILSGCSGTVSHKVVSAPISAERAQLIIDGQTTKTDIITMFGNPNGFIQNMAVSGGYDPQSPYMNQKTNIMHYKDCVIGSSSKSGIYYFSSSGSGRLKCKVFTALLDDKDIVVAHAFIEDNLVTKVKLSEIQPKKSSRKDVIRQLGGPSSMTNNGNDEIYLYKDCITNTKTNMFASFTGGNTTSSEQNCQQASIVINEKTGIVEKVSFFPFLQSK